MNALVLDVETVALDDAAEFIEEPEAPSNWKDPEKIAAYIKDARAKAIGRCALDVDLCRVVCLGWHRTIDSEPRLLHAGTATYEAAMIAAFWNHAEDTDQIIGFNILGFDLPVLIRRSQYLGVPVPALNLDRYRTPHVDLMERLSFNGKLKYRSLDFYCKRFGIDVPDEHSGKDIAALVQAGDWDGVASHCRCDVLKTKMLAERIGVLSAMEVA